MNATGQKFGIIMFSFYVFDENESVLCSPRLLTILVCHYRN